ncbi:MAG: hypothetical protein PWR00_1237 [Thermovirga sp.]|nr:hypothetical protein [Thermovirga sp.]
MGMNITISQNKIFEKVVSYWDWRSKVYDKTCSKHHQWQDVFLAPFEGKHPLTILEMGSGTGFLSIGFAKRGHEVIGVDISPKMISFARKEAAKQNVNTKFHLGNAERPPSFPILFDGIVCRNLLWTLPNPLKAIVVWKKLLKPGGRIVISDGLWEPRLYLNKEEAVTVKFKEAYDEISTQLPFFLGLSVEDGISLLKQAGFSQIKRYDHLFSENPYEHKNEFFVLSAQI